MATNESNRITADDLAQFELFRNDCREGLEWLADRFEVVTYEAGDIVANEGDPADRFGFILEGEIHFGRAAEGYGTSFVGKTGSAVGVLPFSRMKVYGGRGLTVTRTRIALMDVVHLRELISRLPNLTQKLVGEMTDRTREFTRFDERKNKMLALGKLSAGLAHELNNPASAAVRSSGRLRDVLLERRREALAFRGTPIPGEAEEMLVALNERLVDCMKAPVALDALEMTDLECEMTDWLENAGAPVELASDLIAAGVRIEQLQPLAKLLSTEATGHGLRILVADYRLLRLTGEIEEASKRISDLIQAVKEYSYMDRTPLSQVNIGEGINVTLRMFQHQLKHGFQVKLNYSAEVPAIAANGNELNQIWTNLIDNALDAMQENADGNKVLEIRTALEPFDVLVEIADNGPGMPPEIQNRIFEPFYTTKAVGEGTGLGLDIVRRIVENHKGSIRVTSRPGRTVFEVRLPVEKA